jgi:hypothetical protein
MVSPRSTSWSVHEKRWNGHCVDGRTLEPSAAGTGTGSLANPTRFTRKSWSTVPIGSVRRRSTANPRHRAIAAGTLQNSSASSSLTNTRSVTAMHASEQSGHALAPQPTDVAEINAGVHRGRARPTHRSNPGRLPGASPLSYATPTRCSPNVLRALRDRPRPKAAYAAWNASTPSCDSDTAPARSSPSPQRATTPKDDALLLVPVRKNLHEFQACTVVQVAAATLSP